MPPNIPALQADLTRSPMQDFFTQIDLNGFLLLKCIAGFLSASVTILFGNNVVILEAIFILSGVDLITGIMKSNAKNECEYSNKSKTRFQKILRFLQCVTSGGLKNTAKKLTMYLLLLIAAYQLTKITPALLWVTSFMAGFISITEMLSIIENLSAAGIIIPKWFIKKLRSYLETGEFK